MGDFGQGAGDRDVIVEHKDYGLKRISLFHPLYMPMQYPLLFPYGKDFLDFISLMLCHRSSSLGLEEMS